MEPAKLTQFQKRGAMPSKQLSDQLKKLSSYQPRLKNADKFKRIVSILFSQLMGQSTSSEDQAILQAFHNRDPLPKATRYVSAPSFHSNDVCINVGFGDESQFDSYFCEVDYNPADYIISFANPDHKSVDEDTLTIEDAHSILGKIFPRGTDMSPQQTLEYETMRQAFHYGLLALPAVLNNSEAGPREAVSFMQPDQSTLDLLNQNSGTDDQSMNTLNFEPVHNFYASELQRRVSLSRGGFLEKHKTRSGSKYWSKSRHQTRDFMTLVRHAVLIHLARNGFRMRQLMSRKGDKILVVLYAHEANLQSVAESEGFMKKLNFELTDLLSLEPVDVNLRPLRLNPRLWRPSEYAEELKNDPEFDYLRKAITTSIQRINFKRLSREAYSAFNPEIFNEMTADFVEDRGPTISEWKAYYEYLVYVESQIEEIRALMRFSDDDALILNRIKTVEELEIRRKINDMMNRETLGMGLSPQITPKLKKSLPETPKLVMKRVYQDENEQDSYLSDTPSSKGDSKEPPDVVHVESRKVRRQREMINSPISNDRIKALEQEFAERYPKQMIDDCIHSIIMVFSRGQRKKICSKYLKLLLRQRCVTLYRRLLEDAMHVSNYGGRRLYNFWGRLGLEPLELSCEFVNCHSYKIGIKKRSKLGLLWKQYELSELGKTSYFSNMERLTLIDTYVQNIFNLNFARRNGFIIDFTPLNDPYEKDGGTFKPMFDAYFERLRAYSSKHQIQLRQPLLEGRIYAKNYYIHAVPKPSNLTYMFRVNWLRPWQIPIAAIRDYYGEKIALYFYFLSYYTKNLFIMSLVALAQSIFHWVIIGQEINENYSGIALGVITVFWVNYLTFNWRQEEKIFGLRFGLLNHSTSLENATYEQKTGGELTSFQGVHVRSLENDELNVKYYPTYKLILKLAMTYMVFVVVLVIYALAIAGIFFMSQALQASGAFGGDVYNLNLPVTLPALVNVVLIVVFGEVYQLLAERLNAYENHQTEAQFEASYIGKRYIFSLLNLIGPLIQIAYMNVVYDLPCVYNDCYRHAQYHFAVIYLALFMLNFWELIKAKLESERNELFAPISLLDELKTPFEPLDEYIHKELEKSSYDQNEYDGTVDDTLEIILQFGLLCVFGMSFSICFFIAFIWNALELHSDKLKLMKYMRRPIPKTTASLGIWNDIMNVVQNMSIILNTGNISYLYSQIEGRTLDPITFFTIMLLLNFFQTFVADALFGSVPYQLSSIFERHNYLLKSTLEKYKSVNTQHDADRNEDVKLSKQYPIYKVFGSMLPSQFAPPAGTQESIVRSRDSFESVSSDEADGNNEGEGNSRLNAFIKERSNSGTMKSQLQTKCMIDPFVFVTKQREKVEILKSRDKHQHLTKVFQSYLTKFNYLQYFSDRSVQSHQQYLGRSALLQRNLKIRRVAAFILTKNQELKRLRRKYRSRLFEEHNLTKGTKLSLEDSFVLTAWSLKQEKIRWKLSTHCRKTFVLYFPQRIMFNSFRRVNVLRPSIEILQDRIQRLHEEEQMLLNQPNVAFKRSDKLVTFVKIKDDERLRLIKTLDFVDIKEMPVDVIMRWVLPSSKGNSSSNSQVNNFAIDEKFNSCNLMLRRFQSLPFRKLQVLQDDRVPAQVPDCILPARVLHLKERIFFESQWNVWTQSPTQLTLAKQIDHGAWLGTYKYQTWNNQK